MIKLRYLPNGRQAVVFASLVLVVTLIIVFSVTHLASRGAAQAATQESSQGNSQVTSLGTTSATRAEKSSATSLQTSSENSVPNDDPILLDGKVLGRLIKPLESFVPHLSDHELRQAINFSRVTGKQLRLKNLEAFKVESWKTKIEPPRDVPLIGKAQLHRTFFTCLIQFVDGDGTDRERTIIVEKNQFEVLVPEDLLWQP